MENLLPEARAIYEIITAETREAYENRFLDYKKESLDAVRTFVEDTTKQFASVNASIATVQASMGTELAAVQAALGADLAIIKGGLSAKISQLASTVGRAIQSPRPASVEGAPGSIPRTPGVGAAGPHGNCIATNHRGMASAPPPVGATWLESFLTKSPHAGWDELVRGMMARFMRNQHTILLRRFYHITQTATVEDYVQRFSDLVDQLSAYEPHPESIRNMTRFLDGLKPAVRVLVAIQQPEDLDTAFTLALLYEELGEGTNPFAANSPPRQGTGRTLPHTYPPPPPPPAKWVSKSVEEKKQIEATRGSSDDKWSNLKAYRRAKGLCFICGEKWGKEHVCKGSVQLHIVQEKLNCMQTELTDEGPDDESDTESQHLMCLSVAAADSKEQSQKTLQLRVTVQGHSMLFLVDSGSSACFIDQSKAHLLTSQQKMDRTLKVQVARGEVLQSSEYFPQLGWSAGGHDFVDSFRVPPLKSYDGIVGHDSLAKHSPMLTHWSQHWLVLFQDGQLLVLHGEGADDITHALIELHVVQDIQDQDAEHHKPGVQELLDKFSSVFDNPTSLPPSRQYDHQIPLIPGARPVSMRPYRVALELKSELEKQIQELLKQGVITHINSAFASPVILVKKSDHTWRLVVDYRHLNALTVKGKYPLPVIDELLDELAGSKWFSKLDLRASYYQIRLAPGEEYKTAFQTHNGHYEFMVMAFGLTGAPATFQFAMNASLAPVLRKFALVFFDDILIYSHSYEEHLGHVQEVLAILQRDK
ncbi:uncharacterized protein [Lolium perenne]|uniref:uncharacterized protein n=1 Tax=Lolium perenne TaxID=4522 RepID=UPI003A997964